MLQPISETYLKQYDLRPKQPLKFPYEPEIDLSDLMLFTKGQPWETYKTLRENAPICWHEMPETFKHHGGYWAVTEYDAVKAISIDQAHFSSQKGGIMMDYGTEEDPGHPLLNRASLDTMICLDQPYHLELRREHMPWFTPSYITELRKKVEAQVTKLLDQMAPLGKADLVHYVSQELPLFTLSEILGIPEADRPKLIKWMHYLELARYVASEEQPSDVDPKFISDFMENVQEMFDYGLYQLKQRRANPQNDLLTAIAQAQLEGAPLADEYLDGSWLLIVFAGNDTTRNSISGTMKLLSEFPEEKQKVMQDGALLPNMVHEAIRMVSPVIYMRRTCILDTEVLGQSVSEGEKVVMYYGAANRDPAIFPDPDRFDVTRVNAKNHLAFGFGPHVCLGQRVANMQLESVYAQIFERFPGMTWTGHIDIAPNNFVHAIRELEVEFTPEVS